MIALLTMATVLQAVGSGDVVPRPARPHLAYPRRADGASRVARSWQIPPFSPDPEPAPTETLAQALDGAYRSAPALQVQRYELRATDEDYALAQAETRATTQLELSGGYNFTNPGRLTDDRRSLLDRLTSPNITDNSVSAQLSLEQPLYTGGRAAADREIALNAVGAARAQLRATEGDLFLQVISAYADVRRDARVLRLREANLRQLEATRAEVIARQEAGELTRTDIAQAETQLAVARAQFNSASQQLEQDRTNYAALVGHEAGALAPEPTLPGFPRSTDHAFDLASQRSPDLAQAIAAERSSRSRIAAAAAEGQPRLSLRGTATLTDQAVPLRAYNADRGFSGQAVLTVPLTNGGRVGALIAQARDRNAADRLRIEAARRQMVQGIVDAWNAVATAQRNIEVQAAQLAAARVLNEGTFEEYRAGLRSTFDVLFAQGSLRDAEIALVGSRREIYVAQAALLRRLGTLEAATVLKHTPLYDPAGNLRHAAGRGALPWDGVVRAIDRFDRRQPAQRGLMQPALPDAPPALLPASSLPEATPATGSPNMPIPGTTGAPLSPRATRR